MFLDCGIPPSNTIRDSGILSIVGGSEVTPYSLPWQVGIAYPGSKRPYCGGTLIGPRHVLTAAHCVDAFLYFEVIVGEHEVVYDSTDGTAHTVCGMTSHPLYDDRNVVYDFAIIRLQEPVETGPRAVPACLATSAMGGDALVGETVTVSGWGDLEEDGYSPNELHSVDLQVIANSDCYPGYDWSITDVELCAGNLTHGGIDSCQGDSGGIYI